MPTPMPTSKKRINLSVSKETEEILQLLAKRDQMPIASKALQLIELAIEIDEDEVWTQIAEERDTPDAEWIIHDQAWK